MSFKLKSNAKLSASPSPRGSIKPGDKISVKLSLKPSVFKSGNEVNVLVLTGPEGSVFTSAFNVRCQLAPDELVGIEPSAADSELQLNQRTEDVENTSPCADPIKGSLSNTYPALGLILN